MSPGEIDVQVVRRHLFTLDEALRTLRKYSGLTVTVLESDQEKLWVVERGLQLCAQNVLDVATHIAASTGHDVPDYAAAIDRLADADFDRYLTVPRRRRAVTAPQLPNVVRLPRSASRP